MNDITALALIAKIKKQTESFDTVVLKEAEAKALVEALEKAQQQKESDFEIKARLCKESNGLHDRLREAEKRIAELEKTTTEPVAWTDEQELRDVEHNGCGYLFTVNPITPHADPRRIIKLYKVQPSMESHTVTVKLRKRSVGEVMHMSGFSRDYAEGWCSGNDNAIHEMRTAGI